MSIQNLLETATPEMKAVLWVSGRLHTLVAAGLITGDPGITTQGLALFDQLVASGYRCSEDEAWLALITMGRTALPDDDRTTVLVSLILNWSPADVPGD